MSCSRVTYRGLQLLLSVGFVVTVGLGSADALASASTKTSPPPPTYNSKCQTTAMSQIAMDNCIGGEATQLNSEMKVALSDEAGQLGKGAVTAVQQVWIQFEEAECRLEDSGYKGGTIQPLIFGACERGLLVQRISEIDTVIRTAPH